MTDKIRKMRIKQSTKYKNRYLEMLMRFPNEGRKEEGKMSGNFAERSIDKTTPAAVRTTQESSLL